MAARAAQAARRRGAPPEVDERRKRTERPPRRCASGERAEQREEEQTLRNRSAGQQDADVTMSRGPGPERRAVGRLKNVQPVVDQDGADGRGP